MSRSQTSQAAAPVSIAQWAVSQPSPHPPGLTASCSQAIERTSWSTYASGVVELLADTDGSSASVRMPMATVSADIAGSRMASSSWVGRPSRLR